MQKVGPEQMWHQLMERQMANIIALSPLVPATFALVFVVLVPSEEKPFLMNLFHFAETRQNHFNSVV